MKFSRSQMFQFPPWLRVCRKPFLSKSSSWTPNEMHKRLDTIYTLLSLQNYVLVWKCKQQGSIGRGVTRGPGGERFPGRRKAQTTSPVVSPIQQICFRKNYSEAGTWGRQTCFLPRGPSNLVTSLSMSCWMIARKKLLSTRWPMQNYSVVTRQSFSYFTDFYTAE